MGSNFEAVVSVAKEVFGSRVIGRGKSSVGSPVIVGRGGVPFEIVDQGCTALVQTPNGYRRAVDYCRLSQKQIGSRLLDILEEEECWRRGGEFPQAPAVPVCSARLADGVGVPGPVGPGRCLRQGLNGALGPRRDAER